MQKKVEGKEKQRDRKEENDQEEELERGKRLRGRCNHEKESIGEGRGCGEDRKEGRRLGKWQRRKET